jgi:hypothetical protein
MLDDDTRDQIPLFELPPPENPEPGIRTQTAGLKDSGPGKQPATGKAPQRPKEPNKPARRETKRKKAPRPPVGKATEAKAVSGLVPEGDVRLTANIRQDLHLRLKIAAAHLRTTIGEIIEELVEKHIK